MTPPIKIELPEGLRRLIADKRDELVSALEHAPTHRVSLETEISKIESIVRQLNDEISVLKVRAVTEDPAAADLNTKETRLREAGARLARLRDELENLRPLTLIGTRELLQAVLRFYSDRLPNRIITLLSPVCEDYATALRVANQCDSVTALRHFMAWSYGLDNERATTANVDLICSIFDRALRGQLHLGVDLPQKPPATEGAAT